MFKKINAYEIEGNSIKLFKSDCPIVVFGNLDKHNGLTVAWGTLGCLWSKEIATVYVKPTRYSFDFANSCEYFTIMWFDELKDEVNKVFGFKSGRDVNKEQLCNLTPLELDGAVAYKEASLIIVCKKIYQNPINKDNILSEEVLNKPLYQDGLFHYEYFGEIVSVYKKAK
jgi:flavin reductase (DIM6/NTAB) family NADH-FMN oxidoreductase RutF